MMMPVPRQHSENVHRDIRSIVELLLICKTRFLFFFKIIIKMKNWCVVKYGPSNKFIHDGTWQQLISVWVVHVEAASGSNKLPEPC